MNNKYLKNANNSEAQFRVILKLFCLEIQASNVAVFTDLNRVTINHIFDKIRVRIATICESESPFTNGARWSWMRAASAHVEYAAFEGVAQGVKYLFGACSSEATGCTTQGVKNCSVRVLLPIIQGHADTGAVLYTDGLKTYDGLADFGYKKHYRVKHGENEFADGVNHINSIENFWGLCKVRLAKLRGVHKHKFYLHIKECEFRYNYRSKNIYLFLLKNCRKMPLF